VASNWELSMLDIGGTELLVIAIVALVVIGPKELPAMLRTIGRFMGMVKRQAQEFRNQFDEAIRDSEFQDLQKSVNELRTEASNTISEFTKDIDKEVRDAEAIGEDLKREVDKSARVETAEEADKIAQSPSEKAETKSDPALLEGSEREAAADGPATPDETRDVKPVETKEARAVT
jgi:sec-independent protein translocase protein TatB